MHQPKVEHLSGWYNECQSEYLLNLTMYDIEPITGFKISRLRVDQLAAQLVQVQQLRAQHEYQQADQLRDQILAAGYYWWLPETVTPEHLRGYTYPRLQLQIDREGGMTLSGYIHEEMEKPGRTVPMYVKLSPVS